MSKTPPANTTLSEVLPNSVNDFLSCPTRPFFTSLSILEIIYSSDKKFFFFTISIAFLFVKALANRADKNGVVD